MLEKPGMQAREKTRTRLLDSAERLIRHNGYTGFSYRDLADEVGITTASIHYHFPAKADLAQAVARRYLDMFFARLEHATRGLKTTAELLDAYFAVFRAGFEDDGGMCLCGMLGSQAETLPQPVVAGAREFFDRNLAWLEEAFAHTAPDPAVRYRAALVLSALEGASIIARTERSNHRLEITIAGLRNLVVPQ